MCIDRQNFRVCGTSTTSASMCLGICNLIVAVVFGILFGPITKSYWTLICLIPAYIGTQLVSVKCNSESLRLRKCAFWQAIILYVAFIPLYVATYFWLLQYDSYDTDTIAEIFAFTFAIYFCILFLVAFGVALIIIAPFSIIALRLGYKELEHRQFGLCEPMNASTLNSGAAYQYMTIPQQTGAGLHYLESPKVHQQPGMAPMQQYQGQPMVVQQPGMAMQ